MMGSKSSRRWLNEHFNDVYVKRAQQEGYPSRAAYKLLEIQDKDKILRKGMMVVDLGAAPGGWSLVAKRLAGDAGRVYAVDLLPLIISGVDFIQGDFTEEATLKQLLELVDNQPVDLVMSDMAPNISGIAAADHARAMYLTELAYDLAKKTLRTGGTFLVKVFQGEGFPELLQHVRQSFIQVKIRKPKSSRARSSEVYLLGLGFKVII